jgi:hypothetical protein
LSSQGKSLHGQGHSGTPDGQGQVPVGPLPHLGRSVTAASGGRTGKRAALAVGSHQVYSTYINT